MAAGFPGEPGADGTGAITDQAGQVVSAPALGRFHHQGSLQPQAQVEQVVMHRAHGQQRWNGGRGGIDPTSLAAPIAQHQDLAAGAHGRLGSAAQALHRNLETSGAIGDGHQRGKGGGEQALLAHRRQLRLIEDRTGQVQHRRRVSFGAQRRAPLAQMHLQAHHQLFAQGIDRRVGDLGKALLEVVVEEVGLV